MIPTRKIAKLSLPRAEITEKVAEKLPQQANEIRRREVAEMERHANEKHDADEARWLAIKATPADANEFEETTFPFAGTNVTIKHGLGRKPRGFSFTMVTGSWTTAGHLKLISSDIDTIVLSAIGYDADPTGTVRVW